MSYTCSRVLQYVFQKARRFFEQPRIGFLPLLQRLIGRLGVCYCIRHMRSKYCCISSGVRKVFVSPRSYSARASSICLRKATGTASHVSYVALGFSNSTPKVRTIVRKRFISSAGTFTTTLRKTGDGIRTDVAVAVFIRKSFFIVTYYGVKSSNSHLNSQSYNKFRTRARI